MRPHAAPFTATVSLIAALLFVSQSAPAQSKITIIKRGAVKSAIYLVDFSARDTKAAVFKATLESDLERSGWFAVARNKGSSLLTIQGSCTENDRTLTVRCRVLNTDTGHEYLSKSFKDRVTAPRKLAHAVADAIVLAVKKRSGIASTRIVMVGTRTGKKELYVCDYDGRNMVQLTDDKSISVAPDWYPDGNVLVYTSYHTGFSRLYRIDLLAQPPRRERLTSFPGLNMSAAISPYGKRMAMSLSKDGNPDLYVMDLKSQTPSRITRTTESGEISPSWSPDGSRVVFVSDSSGRPHLYVANRDGTRPKRITFRGTENVAPDWGPGGVITYSSRRSGHYQICIIDADTRNERQLTQDLADNEEPSWAPDGRHITYARAHNHRSHVYVLDTMGDRTIRLTEGKGDWYFPAWSPK